MFKFTFLLFLSLSVFAQEVSVKFTAPVKQGKFDLGIGSEVQLEHTKNNRQQNALFLGRMIDQESSDVEFMFLDEKKSQISLIDPDNVKGFRKSRAQVLVKPIDQKGSTCTAYGIFHFWNQMNASGFKGSQDLTDTMGSDRTRLQFVEEVIDIYYLQNKTNITTLMKRLGTRFGFTCKNNPFKDVKKAADFLYAKTLEGKPVLIDFNIGPDMVESTYVIKDYERGESVDPRLWVPRIIGQRNVGGHVIVGAAAFTSKGKRKVMVLDSDWSEPRVWDLESYFKAKLAIEEMGFHTCN